MSSPRLSDLAASFRRHLRALGRAPRTIVLYQVCITQFCLWLRKEGRPETLDEMTRAAITAWLEELQMTKGENTVIMRFRGLRRFSRWLVVEGELGKPPTDNIAIPSRMDSDVRIITEDEWSRLMKACARPLRKKGTKFDTHIFEGRRDEVMLRILLDCGLRVSELIGLDLEDVDLDRELVYVTGKGSRPRVIPFSAKTGQAIDRYLRVRGAHRHGSSDALLLTQRGRMSEWGVRWRMEVLRGPADVPGLHPHALRHTFAHRWLMNGGQERDLMNLAGWKTDEMLQVYARTTATERAHAAHRRMREKDSL